MSESTQTLLFAGYFLRRLKPLDFGSSPGQQVYTASSYINWPAFGDWCFEGCSAPLYNETMAALSLSDNKIEDIRAWTGRGIETGKLAWLGILPSLSVAIEFRNRFYEELSDIVILSMAFSDKTSTQIQADFAAGTNIDSYNFNDGDFPLLTLLSEAQPHQPSKREHFIGYDFIGIEGDGSFYSFHCHNISDELSKDFSVTLNQYGLVEASADVEEVCQHLNSGSAAVEQVPWYAAKMFLYTEV